MFDFVKVELTLNWNGHNTSKNADLMKIENGLLMFFATVYFTYFTVHFIYICLQEELYFVYSRNCFPFSSLAPPDTQAQTHSEWLKPLQSWHVAHKFYVRSEGVVRCIETMFLQLTMTWPAVFPPSSG